MCMLAGALLYVGDLATSSLASLLTVADLWTVCKHDGTRMSKLFMMHSFKPMVRLALVDYRKVYFIFSQ